ncbi:SdpI family protein [Polymorphum gilvum]|uniref:SdpI family protein n=1 Tax=Polymorphum gilvum TaxID=991904 RepID=UPI00059BD847|nr:SdpI family protein [Polymorphum gilvum]
MSAASAWLSTAVAVLAILAGAFLPSAGVGPGGEGDGEIAASLGVLAATGIAIVVALRLWALRLGRAAVAPVALRFDAMLVAIGLVFAASQYALAVGGGVWSAPAGRWTVIALALLVFCLGWVSAGIGRNRFVGFRTPRTLADDAAWRAANQRFGRALMLLSPASLLGLFAGGGWGPAIALLPAFVVAVAFLVSDRRAPR